MSDEVVLRPGKVDDYPEVVAVWRSSVDATHGFVTPEDLLEIERELVPLLPAITLTIAQLDDEVVGFAGAAGQRLEMLFVRDDVRGKGVGSQLLARTIEDGVRELDVNEDNVDSVTYYLHRGFEIVRRRDVDAAGRPYPVLTMRLAADLLRGQR